MRFLSRFALCCGICTLVAVSAWGDSPWSRFRGPAGAGRAAEAELPLHWSDSKNLIWKTPLPGRGASSPVVWNERIYLTAYTGYGQTAEDPGDLADLRLHTLCLDFGSGEILWDREVGPAEAEQKATPRIIDHGYASPTPAVDDSGVYVSFGPSGLLALEHDGSVRWRRSVGSKTAGFGAAASPLLFPEKNLVIMNASIEDDAVYGVDRTTGKTVWRTEEITRTWTTPTLVTLDDGSSELVLNQKGAILGLDPATGERLWHCHGIEDYVVPCVVADGETLYCSGGRQNMTIALRAGGRGDVTDTRRLWEIRVGANVTSPVLHEGYLYWAHDKSQALCVRAADGEMMYRERLPTRNRVYASAVVAGDRLLMTTRDQGVLVVATNPERFEVLATNRLGGEEERFNATPAVVEDSLLLRSNEYLYRVGSR